MNDVIDRLKAAKAEDDRDAREAGQAAGRMWAKDIARPRELQRLELAASGPSVDYAVKGWADGPDVDWSYAILNQLFPTRSLGTVEVSDFWDAVTDRPPSEICPEFAAGFAEGALEVWGKVKPQI